MTDILPDNPRLRRGVTLILSADGLLVRSVSGSLLVPPDRAAGVATVLHRLDGRCGLDEAVDRVDVSDALYALRVLGSLAHKGLAVAGPVRPATPPRYVGPTLAGVAFDCVDDGPLARELCSVLVQADADCRLVGHDAASDRGRVRVVCPAGLDLASSSALMLPVLPFGDAVMVGPVATTVGRPCLRCLELRWLALSPTITLERAFLDQIRLSGTTSLIDAGRWREALPRVAAVVARIALDHLAGRPPHAGLLILETATVKRTRLIAHPNCERCRPSATIAREQFSGTEDAWLGEALPVPQLRSQLDPFVGLPSGFCTLLPRRATQHASDPPLHVTLAQYAIPDLDGVDGAQANWAHGASPDAVESEMLAIVEALERYAGLSLPRDSVRARFDDLIDAVLPTTLPLYSETQYRSPGFPFRPFSSATALRWSRGYDLMAHRVVHVPTSAAWYSYDDELMTVNSSGVAAHSCRGAAILNGLLELVERDAFMIHWLHRLSPPTIPLAAVRTETSRALLSAVLDDGYSVSLLDLTTDLSVPVALAVGYRTDELKPALIAGAGAALSLEAAIGRALPELYAATLYTTEAWKLAPPMRPDDVTTLADHSRAYQHPAWLAHAKFLWQSDMTSTGSLEPRMRGDYRKDLADLLAVLRAHGLSAIAVELTPADLEDCGVHVMRVLVPGLQPLGAGQHQRLGGRRLFDAPYAMGYSGAARNPEDLSLVPHCFP